MENNIDALKRTIQLKDNYIKLKDNYIKGLDGLLESRASEIRHLQTSLSKYIDCPQPVDALQKATNFAEWIFKNNYNQYQIGKFRKPNSLVRFTTEELFQKFLESQPVKEKE